VNAAAAAADDDDDDAADGDVEIYEYVVKAGDGGGQTSSSGVFRPTLLDCKQDVHGCSDQLASLVRRCWSEDVVERPDFSTVKTTVKRISKFVNCSHLLTNNSLILAFSRCTYNELFTL